jgi:hypothetical protein
MTAPITDAALAEIERLAQEAMGRDGVLYVRYAAMAKLCQMLPAVTARLRAAELAREAEGWEDILLAPHDGTFVLVWCDHTPVVAFYEKAFGFDKEPAWRPVIEISRRLRPTHWRPLPAPPAPRAEVG